MGILAFVGQTALGTAFSQGSDLISNQLNISPKGRLGTITIQATIEESHTDTVQVTEHPVEQGVEMSDHAYSKNPEYTIRCGWSNSGQLSLSSALNSITSGSLAASVSAFVSDGTFPTISDYVSSVYQQLQQLQQSLVPFDVVSSLRVYPDMMMTSLNVSRDQKTYAALMVTATVRQIRVVSTSSTTLPPIQNQANPEDTAEINDTGVQAPISATPAAGGSYPVPTPGFS